MIMNAYTDGKQAVLARPMTNFRYFVDIEEWSEEDLEGETIKNGYFIVFNECSEAWYPQANFEEQYQLLGN